MKQEMHTFIATLLVVLTIKIFFPKQQFYGLENEDETVMFMIDWVAPCISFTLWWLYIINQ